MVPNLKETIFKEKSKGKVFTPGKIILFIKDNGNKIK